MPNYPKNIIVHHSLVSRFNSPSQFDSINRYHKGLGWGKIGYHFLIEPDGQVKIGRAENEVGAHTKQMMMNYLSIGICLSGNFDIDDPTPEQIASLLGLIEDLQKKYGIPDKRVKLHRDYAKYKSCPGTRIPNDIKGYLKLKERTIPQQIEDNTKILKARMDKVHEYLEEANAVKKYVAQLKGVQFNPYRIMDDKAGI